MENLCVHMVPAENEGVEAMIGRNTTTHHAARRVSNSFEPLVRLGYATKGAVYAVIGVLAVMMAVGAGGASTSSRGALQIIAEQPFGRVLVGVTALGLLGYALWRFVQAIRDPEGKGADAKGIIQRLGYGGSGIVHIGLMVVAARLALMRGGGGGDSQQAWTAKLMAQPFGQWLVGLVGAIVIGIGLYHFYQAYKATFMKEYKTGEMSATERRWAKRCGQFGLVARGVTFGIIGGFLITAAVQADASEAKGLAGALTTLAYQPYGPWLLGVVALGLIAYSVFCFSQARYRHLPIS
jgi:Domain of Unknown Function (DUF1206)